ncbi:hypothetical protein H2200_008911 [Cladophialophora chaetospira]|uniref:BTB domain-containing protein n=1 Tax=Cladophialophora chaetospira TaxID=386627 RepID=A0AA38X534_9EURO|nr:hypothetical protein H2200_008911 [Cladophialophora chaetospira]
MLRTACDSDFREAASGQIDLSEDDPKIVTRVVLFMYTSDYDPRKVPAFLIPGQAEEGSPMTEAEGNNSSSNAAKAPARPKPLPGKKGRSTVRTMTAPEKEPVTAETFEALKINALVYKCADFLGIENLKMLAAERFMSDARVAYLDEKFAEPLQVMYESTRPDDEYLRVPATALCVKHGESFPAASDTVKVLEEYEHSVWGVYKPLFTEGYGQDHSRLDNLISKINDRLSQNGSDCGNRIVETGL